MAVAPKTGGRGVRTVSLAAPRMLKAIRAELPVSRLELLSLKSVLAVLETEPMDSYCELTDF